MALTSAIIRRAFRESNLIPVGQDPTTSQVNEALELLNTLVLSTVGNEAGVSLNEIIIGGDFDQTDLITDYIPDNVRLNCQTLDAPIILGLDPYPKDGQRVAIVDTSGNMSTNTVTLDANGRTIESGTEVTIDVDYASRQWMFRADTGNWVRVAELVQTDVFPFPTEFDDYFSTMLALRVNPRYSQQMSPEAVQALNRQRSQLRSRYQFKAELESDVKPYGMRTEKYSRYDDFDTGSTSTLSPYLPDRGF